MARNLAIWISNGLTCYFEGEARQKWIAFTPDDVRHTGILNSSGILLFNPSTEISLADDFAAQIFGAPTGWNSKSRLLSSHSWSSLSVSKV